MGRVFNALSLFVVPVLLRNRKRMNTLGPIIYMSEIKKNQEKENNDYDAYLSSVFGGFTLVLTSHNLTVESAEPDARSDPSQLKKLERIRVGRVTGQSISGRAGLSLVDRLIFMFSFEFHNNDDTFY